MSDAYKFDPAALRLAQNFVEMAGVRRQITRVPVRKPNRFQFVRVNRDPGMAISPVALLEIPGDEPYIVVPELCSAVGSDLSLRALYEAITRDGTLFLWVVGMPGCDGATNPWVASMRQAIEAAKEAWVRVRSNRDLGAYEIDLAQASLPEPEWPTLMMNELLELAFREHRIDTTDHPALRRLWGKV